ncbi:protein amalgam-like [Penaeus chinensis]|uniref:protein amalgam-like n=1 Tax=Penaeus chinensis TaxID=139456 RepID=UPI001FB5E171|nr:protein amalgam-like [Penaeus chinensis]
MFSSLLILFLGLLALTRPLESSKRFKPQMLTEDDHFVAQAGDSVTLPCHVRNPGRRSIFWFKGDTVEGRELVMQLMSVKGNFLVTRQFQDALRSGKLNTDKTNLIINDLSPEDSASYTCSLAVAGQTVTHTLTVEGGSRQASPLMLTALPTDGRVSAGEGFPATLSCVVSGSDAAVSWHKVGSRQVLSVGPVFNIYSVRREDEGSYVCTADNGVSRPASFTFDVTVEYVDVEVDQTEVVASTDDLTALLSCTVKGSPAPHMSWYDSQGPIRQNDPRRRVSSRGEFHYLQLTDMRPSDLGEYQCYGYNEKGRDRETITVTAAPGPVRVLGAEPTGSAYMYRVSWEVNSLSPINYYYFAYRETSSDLVMTINVPGTRDPVSGSSTMYRGSTDVTFNPGETYEIMVTPVSVHNKPGPEQREVFRFSVPLEPVEVVSTNEDSWKWWKMSMALVSRLPQVARLMQD